MYAVQPYSFAPYAARLRVTAQSGAILAGTGVLTTNAVLSAVVPLSWAANGTLGVAAIGSFRGVVPLSGQGVFTFQIGNVQVANPLNWVGSGAFTVKPQFVYDLFAAKPTSRIEYAATIQIYRRKEARPAVSPGTTVAVTNFTRTAQAATAKREYLATIQIYRRKEARLSVSPNDTVPTTSFSTLTENPTSRRVYAVTLNLFGKRL